VLYGRTIKSYSSARVEASERVLPAGLELNSHCHDFAFFTYVITGTVYESLRGSEQAACQYDCRFLPAGEIHKNRCPGGARLLHLSIRHEYVREIERQTPISISLGPMPATMGAFALQLHRELHVSDCSSHIDIESLATLLLCVEQPVVKKGSPPRWLSMAKELLCDVTAETLCLPEIASAVGIHPVHLCREFTRHYGCTMGKFQRSRRISLAGAMMRDTSDSLSEIAYASGFADQSHFTRSFRKVTGLSPLQYRRAFKPKVIAINDSRPEIQASSIP
jgi:AraC family transcriptional regulator